MHVLIKTMISAPGLGRGRCSEDLYADAQKISNGVPTIVKFYADWCEVCQELAPDIYKVDQQYKWLFPDGFFFFFHTSAGWNRISDIVMGRIW